MKALLIKTGNTRPEVIDIDGEYQQLSDTVGGYIESLYIPTVPIGAHAYINEDGKMLGLSMNPFATIVGHELIGISPSDYIAGNMIVLGDGEDGEEADVPQTVVDSIMNLLSSENSDYA